MSKQIRLFFNKYNRPRLAWYAIVLLAAISLTTAPARAFFIALNEGYADPYEGYYYSNPATGIKVAKVKAKGEGYGESYKPSSDANKHSYAGTIFNYRTGGSSDAKQLELAEGSGARICYDSKAFADRVLFNPVKNRFEFPYKNRFYESLSIIDAVSTFNTDSPVYYIEFNKTVLAKVSKNPYFEILGTGQAFLEFPAGLRFNVSSSDIPNNYIEMPFFDFRMNDSGYGQLPKNSDYVLMSTTFQNPYYTSLGQVKMSLPVRMLGLSNLTVESISYNNYQSSYYTTCQVVDGYCTFSGSFGQGVQGYAVVYPEQNIRGLYDCSLYHVADGYSGNGNTYLAYNGVIRKVTAQGLTANKLTSADWVYISSDNDIPEGLKGADITAYEPGLVGICNNMFMNADYCGDGMKQGNEQCDGKDFGCDTTCPSGTTGVPKCTSSCQLDTSSCNSGSALDLTITSVSDAMSNFQKAGVKDLSVYYNVSGTKLPTSSYKIKLVDLITGYSDYKTVTNLTGTSGNQDFSLKPGSYNLQLTVDSDGQVAESNETNNTFNKTITINNTGLCFDTDGGSNADISGSVKMEDQMPSYDVCTDTKTVKEYYCSVKYDRTPQYWSVASSLVTCSGACVNGACVANTPGVPTCTDTDDKNVYNKGYVSGIDKDGKAYANYDECNGLGTQIKEAWCYDLNGGKVPGTMVSDCPFGCADGACKGAVPKTDVKSKGIACSDALSKFTYLSGFNINDTFSSVINDETKLRTMVDQAVTNKALIDDLGTPLQGLNKWPVPLTRAPLFGQCKWVEHWDTEYCYVYSYKTGGKVGAATSPRCNDTAGQKLEMIKAIKNGYCCGGETYVEPKPSATCGNGVIEGNEYCDGSNIGWRTCQTMGYESGTLKCASDCQFDRSACVQKRDIALDTITKIVDTKSNQLVLLLPRPVNSEEKRVMQAEQTLSVKVDPVVTKRLAGKVILQTEAKGEAWFVDAKTGNKFYMQDGNSAYEMLKTFGLGVGASDLDKIPLGYDARLVQGLTDDDKDGLSNTFEEALGSDPLKADTDGDSFNDSEELKSGYRVNGSGKYQVDSKLVNRLGNGIVLQVQGANSRGQAWLMKDGYRYYIDPRTAYNAMRYLSLGVNNDNIRKIQTGGLQ